MTLLTFVLVPLILAALTPTLARWIGTRGLIGVAMTMIIGLFALGLAQLPALANGPLTYTLAWVPQLDLSLSFYMDGLSLLFVTLVTGVGIAVYGYAATYFDDEADLVRFYTWLFVFTGAMLWVVTAGNLLALFIAWELTSVSSFMLIGFKGAKYESARTGALQALMITGGGGLALIAALMLMGNAAGSMALADVLAVSLAEHPHYNAIFVLLALAAFTKSAQFPFHFWLPGAMSAPSPASAFLHSATMVKAGVYLLARFYPTLNTGALWTPTLVAVGLFTLLMGSVLALRQFDLKGILAYTTIAKLGALVALIGLPEYVGYKALMLGILSHALYKAPLFLSAGVIDHATGTRDIRELRGLWGRMPALGIVIGFAALSMAGVIPMLGFVGKETLIEAFIAQPLALAIVIVSAVLTVTVALVLFVNVFTGPEPEALHYHAPSRWLTIAPAGLVFVGSVTGLLLKQTIIPLITPAVPKDFSLYLFPGFDNTAFQLSTAAIVVGLGVYALRRVWFAPFAAIPLPNASRIYNQIVGGVEWVGDQLLRTQNGKLRYYLVVILGSVALLMLSSGILTDAFTGQALNFALDGPRDFLAVVLVVLALGATLASVLFRSQLYAVLALGTMGYAVGGLFLLQPAPDVALVQFLVETLGGVLVIVMLGRISPHRRAESMSALWDTSKRGVWRDIVIATVIGLTVGLFALTAVNNRPARESIATWHLENAYPLTGVVDVVAAVIGDFRATDTLIEIMVFSMAALGVLTVLTVLREQAPESARSGGTPRRHPLSNPLTQRVAQFVMPSSLMIALSHVFYAGNGPGDGFTAGVIAGLGVALWYVVYGYTEAKERLHWLHPVRLIGIGLAVAMVNALLPLLFGREFFAITKIIGIPAPAGLHLASTMIFETGIFLAVFGGTSVIIEAIAHPEGVETLNTQEMQQVIATIDPDDDNDNHAPESPETVAAGETGATTWTPS